MIAAQKQRERGNFLRFGHPADGLRESQLGKHFFLAPRIVPAQEGDVEIHAEKKIILSCEDLEIKTKKTGKIDIGSTFDLNVKDKANIKAGPQLNIKASRVNIN